MTTLITPPEGGRGEVAKVSTFSSGGGWGVAIVDSYHFEREWGKGERWPQLWGDVTMAITLIFLRSG